MWLWSEKTPRRSGGPGFLGDWSRLMRGVLATGPLGVFGVLRPG